LKLELGRIYIKDIQFGNKTHVNNGTLIVNSQELIDKLKEDERVKDVKVDIARPGEKVRIIPVKDVIEPRVKIEGKGHGFAGVTSKTEQLGEGKVNVLYGAAVVTVGDIVGFQEGVIAKHGEELELLADKNNVKLMYEASVGGGIPILNTIRENLSTNEFESVFGILNGTTNFILTQMTENGLDYDQAVKEAQRLGFAEADPSSDVGGDDAAYKLSILSGLAFGQKIHVNDIPKEGIIKISREDIVYAKELGYNIKLLAAGIKKGNEIELSVHPAFIPASHPLSTVKNEYNAVYLKGNAVGELLFYGKGAGSLPTGSAVLEDIIYIVKNVSSSADEIAENRQAGNKRENNLAVSNKGYKQYYINMEVIDKPGVLGSIASIFGKYNVSLASVVQRQKNGDNTVPLVFITHEAERKNIDAALEETKKLEFVTELTSIIIVESFK
jgi:homoserine dehydrogenase